MRDVQDALMEIARARGAVGRALAVDHEFELPPGVVSSLLMADNALRLAERAGDELTDDSQTEDR